jgi:hypothetical protein
MSEYKIYGHQKTKKLEKEVGIICALSELPQL